MMENSLNNLGSMKKGLFEQKGGLLGMVLLAVGAVFFIANLPAIVAFVDSLFHLVIVTLATAGILYVAFDPKVRKIVGTLYMMGIRALLGMVIKLNPIAILEDTINKMYKSIAKVEEKMGTLNGVRKKLELKIKEKKSELESCLQKKKVCEDRAVGENTQKYRDMAVIEDRQSVRLLALVQDYLELQKSSENWYKALSKIAEMANLTVKDAENEVEAMKERYEMVKLQHSAFKSAMSILNGDPDELAMYNQAFQFVNDDIMGKLGEMDRVINTTGGLLDKIDLEKELYSIKGADISKKYEELGIEALFTKMESRPTMAALMAHPATADLDAIGMAKSKPELVQTKAKYF
jgi:hypothetical protein